MIHRYLPTPENVEYSKWYDLISFGYEFGEGEHSQRNWEIFQSIIEDFSDTFNIAPQITKDAFEVERVNLRTSENIMVMYNEIGTDDVYRIYTNKNTPTFRLLFP